MLIEKLNVESFRRFKIPVVNPIRRMFDECPKIIVKVEHQKPETLFFEALRQLDSGGGLTGGTRTTNPHHPQFVAGVKTGDYFFGRFVERGFIGR